jgi:hypothetical protein
VNAENGMSARDFIWDYLSTHPCGVCGEWDPAVLEFRQLYGKDKAINKMIAEGATVEKLIVFNITNPCDQIDTVSP